MSRHSAEDAKVMAEAFADNVNGTATETERYRPRISRCRVFYEVQVVTTHTIRSVNEDVELGLVETERDRPAYVLGARWAEWKARRMVAAAYRRDVREQQPWVVTG